MKGFAQAVVPLEEVGDLPIHRYLRDGPESVDVPALREAILGMAVSGRLLTGGSEGRSEAPPPVEPHPRSNELEPLPAGWVWVRLQDLTDSLTDGDHQPPPKAPRGVPFLTIGNVSSGKISFESCRFVPHSYFDELDKRRVPTKGDILYTIVGSFGHALPVDFEPPFCVQRHIAILRPNGKCARDYLLLFMRSPLAYRQAKAVATGIAQPTVGLRPLREFFVSLPALAEQKRIVAKVDQLMALCDELDAKQTQKLDVGDRLTGAALAALASAETPRAFTVAWKRVDENFAQLITTPEDVTALRDLVLDLGVRGRLSNVENGDESALTLSRDLEALPEQTRRRSSSSSDNPAPPLFDAPTHWVWRPLDQVAEIVGGVTKGRDLRGRRVGSFPYLRVANVQRGSLDLEVMKEIEIPVEELEKYQLQREDILFTEGGDWDKVGRSAVWSGEISPCLHQNHVFRARVLLPGLESRWFSMVGNSPSGRRYFEEAAKQTTNLASINMTQLRAFPMPLPPRQEQRRILTTVERLLTICDELEAKLSQRDERALQLADALVASVVPPVA